jgi:hypothetical protein
MPAEKESPSAGRGSQAAHEPQQESGAGRTEELITFFSHINKAAFPARWASAILTGAPPLILVSLANLWRAIFVLFFALPRSLRPKFQPYHAYRAGCLSGGQVSYTVTGGIREYHSAKMRTQVHARGGHLLYLGTDYITTGAARSQHETKIGTTTTAPGPHQGPGAAGRSSGQGPAPHGQCPGARR